MKKTLLFIVLSQLFCTSVWFAGNAIMSDLIRELHVSEDFLAQLTTAVLLGFIVGTLVFAFFSIADKISPSKVFLVSALFASIFNLGVSCEGITSNEILILRFLVGFSLAGIYPVGMKIAADHFDKNLSKSLGWLVGALVLGTASPHFIKAFSINYDWRFVIYSTSVLSILGGLLMGIWVSDGPYRKALSKFNPASFIIAFKNSDFRRAAFGYFGHMWELYAFWAFLPLIFEYFKTQNDAQLNVSFWSFCVIASGAVSCVLGSIIAYKKGVSSTAFTFLSISLICCILSPLIISSSSFLVLFVFLLIWGMAVIADSPLFSTLVAQAAPLENRGSALTIVNGLGFSITVLSIQLVKTLLPQIGITYIFLILAFGPFLSIITKVLKYSK